MEQNTFPDVTASRWSSHLRALQEIVLSLNVASAMGYALLIYVFKSLVSEIPANDAGYFFLRAAVRMNDLLHGIAVNPVTTASAARHGAGRWVGQAGEEFVVLLSVVGVASVFLLLLRLSTGTRAYRAILNTLSLPIALFAAPACCLWVWQATWQWSSFVGPESVLPYESWHEAVFMVSVTEVLCVIACLLLNRYHPISMTTITTLIGLHYGLWIAVIWMFVPLWIHMFALRVITPDLLLIVSPLSGAVWLLYFKMRKKTGDPQYKPARLNKWIAAGSLVSLVVLGFLWLPRKAYSLVRPRDLQSVRIEISRVACYGACSDYKIVIHGSGFVEYTGNRNVKIHGRQTATISTEQVTEILQRLDEVHFFDIEDRAFVWCFDTPSVGISLSLDGKTKNVVGDSFCTGARQGIQSQFVQAAREIGNIIGSDRWVKCDRYCRD